MQPSQVVIETVESSVLLGNPLGDPHIRRVPVYLPAGYEESELRYPVVYLLAGYTGRGLSMLNVSPWEETLPQRLDRLIRQGSIRQMIVVMPDCFTRYGGSQYINSRATGRYEDHLIQELVPLIDSRYRTDARRARRVVMGKSSGGYGALVLGMRHPDVFGIVVAHSGDNYFELAYKPDFGICLGALAGYGGAEKFLREFPHPPPRSKGWWEAISTLAMAACYSPSDSLPLGFELPFDERTGEIVEKVWQRWLEHDPVNLLERHAEAFRGLNYLYLDCGSRDEYRLQWGTRVFVERLKKLGISHHYEEFDDGHRNLSYRYDVSLAKISERLGSSTDPLGKSCIR